MDQRSPKNGIFLIKIWLCNDVTKFMHSFFSNYSNIQLIDNIFRIVLKYRHGNLNSFTQLFLDKYKITH